MSLSRLLSRAFPSLPTAMRGASRSLLHPRSLSSGSRSVSVELLCNAKAELGGSPFYEIATNQLIWVDKKAHTINFLDVEKGSNRAVQMAERIGAAIPIVQSDHLAVLMGLRIIIVDRESGAVIKELANLESLEAPDIRLNTARCDRLGRLWCGTGPSQAPYDSSDKMGSLYSFGAVIGRLMRHPTRINIINGMDWSRDFQQMFCVDSLHKKIYTFDCDEASTELTNQRLLVDYANNGTRGHPAGMCKDCHGNLWVAGYLGSNVTCWDSKTGEALVEVSLPVKAVTSCSFGGPSFDWLFITTATSASGGREIDDSPHSGGIFVAKNVGTGGERGYKAHLEPVILTM